MPDVTISHVALYCRRSVDPSDLAVSVKVQEKACRRYAAERWPDLPVVAYVDNAISAADPKKERPEFDRLIEAVRLGKVAQVVVREQSRLTRQVDQWEQVCRILQLAGIEEVHQTNGGMVAVSEGSRMAGRLVSVVDAEYVEQIRVKVRATLRENAQEGRPHGHPGYGYQRTVGEDGRAKWVPHPDQAVIVRRMVERIAAGESLSVVAASLNAEGVPTARDALQWTAGSVRSVVTAHRIIGRRKHLDQILPALWDPIVDRSLWEAAQARLGGRPGTTKGNRRQYLLTGGMALCGECGARMISGSSPSANGVVPAYLCPHPSRRDGGCGRCSILADRLEAHVDREVLEILHRPGFAAALNRDRPVSPIAELDQVEADLADLAERLGRRELLPIEHAAARRVLVERYKSLSAAAAATVDAVSPAEILAAYTAGDSGGRRPLLPLVIHPVVVARAFSGGRRLNVSERVTVRPLWE